MSTQPDFTAHLSLDQKTLLADTFATNRTMFAGWKMEAEEGPSEPSENAPADEVDPAPTDQPNDAQNGSEGDDDGLSLEDARSALAKARKEAAASRTRARDLTAALEAAKSPEEVEKLLADAKKADATESRTLLVENVALRHGLPDDLAGVLKGDTREELDAHAKVLAKYVPTGKTEDRPDPRLRGGLNPLEDPDDDFDVKAAVAKRRNSR